MKLKKKTIKNLLSRNLGTSKSEAEEQYGVLGEGQLRIKYGAGHTPLILQFRRQR